MHEHAGAGSSAHSSPAEIQAMLKYMLAHNEHHAEELSDLSHDLSHLGLDGAARELELCVEEYKRGNNRLASVLKKLEE